MKKIHMIAALLAMLLPMAVFATGGGSTTYYAALKAQVSGNSSGMGKVYAGTSNSTPSASSYNASSSQSSNQSDTSSGTKKTFYAFAQANDGYEFVGWSTSNNGSNASTSNPYSVQVACSSSTESSPTLTTVYANFKKKVLASFGITFETTANGTYTVDDAAPANKTGLTEATSVKLASSDEKFLNWVINGTEVTANPYTVNCTANTTISAVFLTADMVTSVTTLSDLTSALSNAQYKKITIPSGTTIQIPNGTTVTVPSGKQLVMDGTLVVLGTLSNSGTISGNGTLYKVSQLITQGDVKTLYNVKGEALGNVALRSNTGKPAKYRTTTVTANSPTVSGTVSCTTSWGAMLNGGAVYAITAQTPKALKVTLKTTACVNEITAVTGTITGDIDVNGDYLLIQNCNLKGPIVVESSKYNRLRFSGTIDLAGKKLTATSYQMSSSFTGLFVNGSIEFCSSSNYLQQGHAAFFNCSSVALKGIKNGGATFYFYDCGSSGSPATISYTYYSTTRTTDYRNAYYYCGVYSYTFSSGNDTDMSHVYAGSYSSDPTAYLYNVDEVEAVYNQTTKYYDVREKREPTYVCVIGTTQYESLTEAVTAAGNGAKIALTAAIDLTGTTLTVPSTKNITISLDKHTVTGGKIVNNGTLTLVDLTDANQGTLGSDIENNGTIDVTYGTYSGNILLNSGTFTTHGGVFTGTISAPSGVDLKEVANLRGGQFSKDPAAALRSDISAIYWGSPKYYWVGMYPAPIITSTTYSGTDKAWKMDFLSSADLALYQKQTDRSEFSSDADWRRRAELESSIHPYDNYPFDCALIFDRDVSSGSVTFAGKTQMGVSESLDKDVSANTYYPVLAKRILAQGYTPFTFKRTILEVKSATAGVKNNSTANNGVVCAVEAQLCTQSQNVPGEFDKLYALAQVRYMLGGKKAAIDRSGSRLAYDSLAAAMAAVQNGERILIGADSSENVTLPGAGTFTVDPYGFAFTGTVSIPSTCFLKSQEEVASSATAQGVASAKAVTYVVALKVAQVGETFYDNLNEAVAAANGGVVTLLAATDETITLTAEGQSFTLNKNGVEFDDAKVVTTVENGSVSIVSGESGTVYTAVTSVVDASDGNKYISVGEAVENVAENDIAVTVTVNVTEEVTLPQGKSLTVTTAPGVTANVSVEAPNGAFIVESAVEGGTKYESKKITVEMAEPQTTVEVTKIEGGTETTVSDSSVINAAVDALMGNGDVPRTDNTDKLDVVDKITVTPKKIVQEVVGAATIIRSATFDVVPTFQAGQFLGEGQKLKFRLPVDAAATQLASIIYHNGEQFGVYPVQTENGQKFVEVESDAFSPYGYELLDGETANPVAAIGTTGYVSLAAAVAAAQDGDTITMLADTAESVTIPGGKSVVLDLNGKTVSCASSTPTISVSANGSLTVADSSTGTSGSVQNTAANGVAIYCDAGSVTVNSGTVGSLDTYRGIVVDHVGTAVVNDGSVIASNAAIRSTSTAHDVITINGGTIGDPTTDNAIYDYDYATITIHGGVLNADHNAIAAFGSTLTIDGGEIHRYGSLANNYAILLGEGGTATISDGTITSGNVCIFVGDAGTTLNITDGTITAAGEATILTNGTKNEAAVINISGGTVSNTGTGSAIFQPNRGATVNVSGNAVVTGPTGIILKGGTLNVSGGSISGTGAYRAPAAMSSGGTSTGDAVYVEDTYSENGNYKPTVNITGGTLTSANGYAAQYYTQAAAATESVANGSISISGNPTLTSSKQTDAVNSTALPNKVNIEGGSFTHAVPEEYCADGYIPTVQDSITGMYTVKTGFYVARNLGTGTGYETLFTAVKEAGAGDTVELLDDVVESITINKDLTLTGAYKITGTLNLDAAASVTMKDITLDANGTIYALNIAGGSSVDVDNVTVGGGTWCNVHLNNGTLTGSGLTMLGEDLAVEADGQHYTYRGERLDASETPPFGLDVTKIPGQTVTLPFMDIVRENGTDTVTLEGSLTQSASMLFVANMPGDETQTGVTLPARFGSYTVTMGAVVSVFGDDPYTPVSGWAAGDWNEIIDTGAAVFDALTTDPGESSDDVDVTLTMNSDVDLGTEPFEFRYDNLTIDGGGNTVSGTIKYTDDAGAVENIVMGTDENPLTLDMTDVTEPVVFGDGVEVGKVEIKLTAEQATAGRPIVTWDAEGGVEAPENESGVSVAIVDGSGEPTGDTADLIWDDELGLAYIGPCEARLTGPTHPEPIYTTLAAAIAQAAQSGDTVTLMTDVVNFTTTQEITKSLTIDGAGHKITAGVNADPRSVISAWGGSRMMFDVNTPETTVTFTDITLDNGESHYFTFLVRAKNGADGSVVFDNVTLLNGGEADAGGTEGVGYGAAVQVDGGNVIVNGDFYADSHGEAGNENGGIFPFTAILYQTGVVHFNDGVTASIGSDLLLVGMEGAVDASTDAGKAIVQEMLDAMNVPAGYYPYTLKLGDSEMTSFTGASPLGWNGIIDYGVDIMTAANTSMGMDMNPATTPVEVGLLADTALPETFTYEDSNLTINGNGNAISGTIEYTDDAGTLENVVMGTEQAPLVLDMTEVTVGNPINLGSGISAENVTIKVTEEQVATMGTTIVTWNTEGQGEGGGESSEPFESGITVAVVDKDTGEPVIDTGTGDPKEASLVWDDEYGRAYVGPCEARLTGPTHADPIYTSLAHAIELAAQSGDTVTLLMDIGNFTGTQDISKSLTLDGAGHKITAAPVSTHRDVVHAWAGSTAMFKLQAGNITFRNITLDGDATHAYTFLVSADNSSVNLTTENISFLNGGELCGDANGAVVEKGAGYGAAIHLNNGAHLTVKDGFYADTHGAPAEPGQTVGMSDGVFPFTGILPEGGSSVLFDLTEDTNAEPTVEIGKDLLLVGMIGAIDSETAQGILDYMKVPSRFRPYTLTLGDGSAYAFTGASLLGWNEIIEYGKEIMDVSTAVGYEGLDKDTTPVEVGLLTDTVLPDTFTFEDSNFTVNGNGNALSGTIKYTDDAGLIENVVFGTEDAPLVLDLRNVTEPVEIGSEISVDNVTVLMTTEQAILGQPVFKWNTDTAEEPDNSERVKVTVLPDAQSEPQGGEQEKGLVWDDEMGVAYIGPCEARLTGSDREPGYMDLTNAFEMAVGGDTVTLFWSNVTLNASLNLPAGTLLFATNKYELALGEDAALVFTNATTVFRSEMDLLDVIALAGDCANGYWLRHEADGTTNVYSVVERGEYIVTGNTEDGGVGTAVIKVSDEWIAANIGANVRTVNEIDAYLNSTNSVTNMREWEMYVLNQTAPFRVTAVGKADNAVSTSLVDPASSEAAGFTVAYSLDETLADGSVKTPGTQQASRDFAVPVASVTTHAFYRVRAHLTSGESTLVVDSANTIGVLKATASTAQTIVAVPWAAFGGGDVTVADLLRTDGLSVDDELFVYNPSTQNFRAWTLGSGKTWEPTTVIAAGTNATPGDDASSVTVARGSGVLLKRGSVSAPLCFVGEVASGGKTALGAAQTSGTDGAQSWNLVASPSVEALDIANFPAPSSGGWDRIIVLTSGAPLNLTYKNGKWGYNKVEVKNNGMAVPTRVTEGVSMPAGVGFWYLNSGAAREIEW